MTPRHWFKMIASALGILLVGLFLVRGANAKIAQIGNFFGEHDIHIAKSAELADLQIPVTGMPFRMNDVSMGTLQSLAVVRNQVADIEGMHFVIKLDKGFNVDRFANCELTVTTPGKIDADTKWLCLAPGDVGYDGLAKFGSIDFLSSTGKEMGPTQRFEVPQSMVDQIREATATAMSQSGASNMGNSKNAGDHFQLTVNGQKVVEIDGSNNGGQVIIRDPKSGSKIVDINGADAGGSVVIRDPATGKNIFEVYGNDAGGVVKVNGVTKVEAKGKP